MHPDKVFLLRGNHECRHLTEHFTFKQECKVKYSENVYDACMKSFDCLPLAALVNKQYFCVHGGISPGIETLADIAKINRFREIPTKGPMCDLLWSDPVPEFDTQEDDATFKPNDVRGCSYTYNFKACSDFITKNNLLTIIRAHEVQSEGFNLSKKHPQTKFPVLITTFSAPNYLDQFQNKAAVIKYANNEMNIRQFSASPHPYWLPNFMDVFTWSLPFAIEKITEILSATMNVCSEEELQEANSESEHKNAIKKKILAIGKVVNAFSEIRKDREASIKLEGLTPVASNPASPKQLLESKRGRINSFDDAKEIDRINERYPLRNQANGSEK